MWLVGIVRTSIVFSLGWLASTGSSRFHKIQYLMDHPLYRSAQLFINRWGVLAVPACFMTVGFQTAVILTTGFTRMPLTRWVPAMLVGTFLWGTIYATVGMSVIWLWLENPAVAVPLLFLLLTLIVLIRWRSTRQSMPRLPKGATRDTQ